MIAGEVYRALPAPQRQYAFFCQLKSEAIGLLKSGMTALLVKSHLKNLLHFNPFLIKHAVNTAFCTGYLRLCYGSNY